MVPLLILEPLSEDTSKNRSLRLVTSICELLGVILLRTIRPRDSKIHNFLESSVELNALGEFFEILFFRTINI